MILVTGAAGFIGYHLCNSLIRDGYRVLGVDNLNSFYDPKIKKKRILELKKNSSFDLKFYDLSNAELVNNLFEKQDIDYVIHLAARAGVRGGIDYETKITYLMNNLYAFSVILEAVNKYRPKKFIFASSGSVYGKHKPPFSEDLDIDLSGQLNIYGKTKLLGELWARMHSEVSTVGLRFFNVYGTYGRPDSFFYKALSDAIGGETLKIFNEGMMYRDWTHVDDIVSGIKLSVTVDTGSYQIFNLGNNQPVNLLFAVKLIESCLGFEIKKELVPSCKGEIQTAQADNKKARKVLGWKPSIAIEDGIEKLVSWYRLNS